jgi:hypothetical protein
LGRSAASWRSNAFGEIAKAELSPLSFGRARLRSRPAALSANRRSILCKLRKAVSSMRALAAKLALAAGRLSSRKRRKDAF